MWLATACTAREPIGLTEAASESGCTTTIKCEYANTGTPQTSGCDMAAVNACTAFCNEHSFECGAMREAFGYYVSTNTELTDYDNGQACDTHYDSCTTTNNNTKRTAHYACTCRPLPPDAGSGDAGAGDGGLAPACDCTANADAGTIIQDCPASSLMCSSLRCRLQTSAGLVFEYPCSSTF